ncbi:MAG: hypothetical protein JWM11_4892 [Planctomycetaceae bacterium]|nr:hypothetical protein [Planctomycetaceae bacterium]
MNDDSRDDAAMHDAANDGEAELLFHEIAPRNAAPELRSRVLSAVSQELSKGTASGIRAAPSWDRRIGTMAAATVVLAVLFHQWAIGTTEHNLAVLAGPRPVPRQESELVEIVESVTGRGTGDWVRQRLVKSRRSRPPAISHRMPDWERLFKDLEI